MATFEELIARAKSQTQALRATLNELATVKIDVPTHASPEIAKALAALHAMKNGFALTEVVEPGMDLFIEGKIEGIESAIETLEGRGAKRQRGGRRPAAPASAPPRRTNGLLAPPAPAVAAAPAPKLIVQTVATTASLDMPKGLLATLRAITQCGDRGCTEAHLGLLTGYKRSSRQTYLSELRTADWIVRDEKKGDRFMATTDGVRASGVAVFRPGEILASLTAGERLVLDAIASTGSAGCTNAHLMALTPYKRTSLATYLSNLKVRELIEPSEKRHYLRELGKDLYGSDLPKKLTGEKWRAKCRAELPEGEGVLFEVLEKTYPEGITSEKLGEIADYKRSSIQTYLSKLAARELVVRAGKGYRLASELFA